MPTMTVLVQEIRPGFVARISGVDMREPIAAGDVAVIQNAIDHHPVLVFHVPGMTNDQQIRFSRNFGSLASATEYQKDPSKRRLGGEMTDASNLSEDSEVLGAGDRRRVNNLGSRRWHTDGSYKRYSGKYSLLSCHSSIADGGQTQLADMRAGYDALPEKMKQLVEGLVLEHSIFHSRAVVGFSGFSSEEQARLPSAQHPLVRVHPASGRKSLYLSSHASHVVGWPVPEGIDLLLELTEWATQAAGVYTHRWEPGDMVMWDNRFTMHRARRHYPETAVRDMRRTTIEEDVPPLEQAA
jgi:alpha-ketoglutarate-dependent 2,4-dichlorophenoxyacetate dioxygenase